MKRPELLVTVSEDALKSVTILSNEEITRALRFGETEREAAEDNRSMPAHSRVRFR